MSLKKLFPLIALVIVLIVGFGYIKPSVDSIFAKLAEKRQLTEELATVRQTRDNFERLVDEREQMLADASGQAAWEFLPVTHRQERVVEIVNRLSQSSGVIVDAVAFDSAKRSQIVLPDEDALLLDGDPTQSVARAPSAPNLSAFTLSAEFRGTYEGLRNFVGGLSTAGRYHDIQSFSLAQKEEELPAAEEGTEAIPAGSDLLSGSLEVEYSFLPEKAYPNAHLLPIFETGSFDTSSLSAVSESEAPLPAMPAPGEQGRPNPFVL